MTFIDFTLIQYMAYAPLELGEEEDEERLSTDIWMQPLVHYYICEVLLIAALLCCYSTDEI